MTAARWQPRARGSHAYMWGRNTAIQGQGNVVPLEKAERTLLFLKHSVDPYLLLIDDVDGDSTNVYQYRQRFLTPVVPTIPSGSAPPDRSNPIRISSPPTLGGANRSLYVAWLVSDQTISASLNVSSNNNPNVISVPVFTGNYVQSTEASAADFRVVLATGVNTATLTDASLSTPATATRGRIVTWTDGAFHLIAATKNAAQPISAAEIFAQARLAWGRWTGTAVQDWFAAEAMDLTLSPPGGPDVLCLQSDVTCTASFRQLSPTIRRLEIRILGSWANGQEILCLVPSPFTLQPSEIFVSDLVRDLLPAVDFVWSQSGQFVTISFSSVT